MRKVYKGKDYIEKGGQKISRKEAIKKAGYAAFSAATMMLLLNDPVRAQTTSDDDSSPGLPDPWDDW